MKPHTLYRAGPKAHVGFVMVLLMALVTPVLHALEVGGVNYQPKTESHGTALQLNGAGVRRFASSDMYTAGLYLERKHTDAQAVLDDSGVKLLRVVLLRDVNGREIAELLTRGMVSNASNDELSHLIPEMLGLSKLIAEQGKLLRGDSFLIDWDPKTGTSVKVQEKNQAKPAVTVFSKPDLIKVMMRIWLGDRPADVSLKSALLGQPV